MVHDEVVPPQTPVARLEAHAAARQDVQGEEPCPESRHCPNLGSPSPQLNDIFEVRGCGYGVISLSGMSWKIMRSKGLMNLLLLTA